MHMHVRYHEDMRTTIEMKPEHRNALIALAARRGEKGFSSVIAEAIEAYLNGEQTRRERKNALLSMAGTLAEKDAEELRASTGAIRETWR